MITPIHKSFEGETQTITLVLKRAASGTKNFRCINCGKLQFLYYGKIQLIFEGRIINANETIEVQCQRCFIDYIIVNASV